MEFIYLLAVPFFSVLWFLNLVQLLEKLKQGKNIHNQKVLGCLWSAGLTLSMIFAMLVFL
ncbi:hypothetical protein [Psychrobacillus lasiicapitis]|uniref:Uncharacterized protein n=1 Tax=Psychrobacillus lasiicapitis TaxID=1636719 RepID=A0A544TI85_9BACI|nr:hypothetical protein [Psychrobacillus lasiicapitis]TQR17088.1 hypothetical protein FG382_02775 [Psychrobacillus lasiicapitis]GGA24618.1 hypothetical protein GCM10011384_12240 [Psychrobacillus lasiicapitis]